MRSLFDFCHNLQLLRLATEASSFVAQGKMILNSPLWGCLRSFSLGRLARGLCAQSRDAVGYGGSLFLVAQLIMSLSLSVAMAHERDDSDQHNTLPLTICDLMLEKPEADAPQVIVHLWNELQVAVDDLMKEEPSFDKSHRSFFRRGFDFVQRTISSLMGDPLEEAMRVRTRALNTKFDYAALAGLGFRYHKDDDAGLEWNGNQDQAQRDIEVARIPRHVLVVLALKSNPHDLDDSSDEDETIFQGFILSYRPFLFLHVIPGTEQWVRSKKSGQYKIQGLSSAFVRRIDLMSVRAIHPAYPDVSYLGHKMTLFELLSLARHYPERLQVLGPVIQEDLPTGEPQVVSTVGPIKKYRDEGIPAGPIGVLREAPYLSTVSVHVGWVRPVVGIKDRASFFDDTILVSLDHGDRPYRVKILDALNAQQGGVFEIHQGRRGIEALRHFKNGDRVWIKNPTYQELSRNNDENNKTSPFRTISGVTPSPFLVGTIWFDSLTGTHCVIFEPENPTDPSVDAVFNLNRERLFYPQQFFWSGFYPARNTMAEEFLRFAYSPQETGLSLSSIDVTSHLSDQDVRLEMGPKQRQLSPHELSWNFSLIHQFSDGDYFRLIVENHQIDAGSDREKDVAAAQAHPRQDQKSIYSNIQISLTEDKLHHWAMAILRKMQNDVSTDSQATFKFKMTMKPSLIRGQYSISIEAHQWDLTNGFVPVDAILRDTAMSLGIEI